MHSAGKASSGAAISSLQPAGDVFVAIDFETANHSLHSACAIGLVRVEDGRITERRCRLIRPPDSSFEFTYIHGITWEDVKREPDFATVWLDLVPLLGGARFLAAHNASFDRGVLEACCAHYSLQVPPYPFVCTAKLFRRLCGGSCGGLPVHPEDPLLEAEACVQIVLHARDAGISM